MSFELHGRLALHQNRFSFPTRLLYSLKKVLENAICSTNIVFTHPQATATLRYHWAELLILRCVCMIYVHDVQSWQLFDELIRKGTAHIWLLISQNTHLTFREKNTSQANLENRSNWCLTKMFTQYYFLLWTCGLEIRTYMSKSNAKSDFIVKLSTYT